MILDAGNVDHRAESLSWKIGAPATAHLNEMLQAFRVLLQALAQREEPSMRASPAPALGCSVSNWQRNEQLRNCLQQAMSGLFRSVENDLERNCVEGKR